MGHQVFWLSNLMLPVLDTEKCFKEYLLLHINSLQSVSTLLWCTASGGSTTMRAAKWVSGVCTSAKRSEESDTENWQRCCRSHAAVPFLQHYGRIWF